MQNQAAKVIITLFMLSMLVFSIQTVVAEGNGFILYGTGNLHGEVRKTWSHGTISAFNFDILAGADFLLLDPIYLGARFGWYAETVCTSYMAPQLDIYQKPSLGFHAAYRIDTPTSLVTILLGLSSDFLLNFDQLHVEQAALGYWWELVYWFLGVNGDVRFNITDNLFLGLSVEAGVFPFFQPAWPIFAKAGVQLGVGF
jgi:hypothetical protein